MILIALALLLVIVIAGLITAYVAYPERGESIPHAEWLSDAMVKARDKIQS
jgi:hypothetical protein